MNARTCERLEERYKDYGLIFIDSEAETIRYAVDDDKKAVAVLLGQRVMVLKPDEANAVARELPWLMEVYLSEH